MRFWMSYHLVWAVATVKTTRYRGAFLRPLVAQILASVLRAESGPAARSADADALAANTL